MTLNIITMIILAYLSGSLSGAMFISRWMKLANPNKNGSNNPGATNVYRLSGKVPAILVLLFDMAKGCIPVLFSYHIGITSFFLGIVGIAACLGHMYPCFFIFKVGRVSLRH